jgi:pyruvate/2-oxoglutarate dehydrogenase complex dihydrolipoamide dehydrogenase (E3) component
MQEVDHVIVGTGQATGTLLGRLIPTGESVAVIEGGSVGGTCVNVGCTPTKTLVASARALHFARRGSEFGFHAGRIDVDFPRVRERMNAMRHGSRDGLTGWMEASDSVTLLREWARFDGDRVLVAGNHRLRGKRIYLNVGTRAAVPPIAGLDSVPWLDNARLLDLDRLPEHLVIVGGGYVGVEFAQIFRRFGSEVTLLQRSGQLMPREDSDVAESIRELLENEGVRVETGVRIESVSPTARGVEVLMAAAREVSGTAGGGETPSLAASGPRQVSGSHLLVATGRRPNSDWLNLTATSIETDERGFIRVDDSCQTAVPGVFAVGDVNGHGAFTHTSVNDAEIVLDHIFDGPRTLSARKPVYALFSDPPLGRVGLTEKEAAAQGYHVLKATRPMDRIGRAKEMSETHGFAKLLVDGDTDLILGAAIIGPGADEIINMFAAIMHSEIPCRHYRQVVLVHPTVSELMPWILDGIAEVRAAEPTTE